MNIRSRVMAIVDDQIDYGDGYAPASVEKMIKMAYYMGRESATRKVSDDYRDFIAKMRERAHSCRYHAMADAVIGELDYIYEPDYAGDMTAMFGGDAADI